MILNDKFYKSLIENMISGFAFHRIITDEGGRPVDYEYIEINRAFEKLTGLLRENVIGKKVTELIPGIDNDEFDWVKFFGGIALGGEPDSIEQYSAALNKWYTVNAYSTENGYFMAIFNDITELKQKEMALRSQNEELGQVYEELTASEEELRLQNEHLNENQRLLSEKEEKLSFLAYYDVVTGLPNRTLFTNRMDIACMLSRRSGKKSAVLFMDLDNFKRINDSFGHSIGDEVLTEIGKRFSSMVREYDTVARIGGDEFMVILQEIESEDDIIILAEKLKTAFIEPFATSRGSCYSAISIGIAVFPDDGMDTAELLKHADTALYKAKEQGKNGIQFFSISMRDDVLRKSNIESRLRNAIGKQEFVLHYQPQFDVNTGKLRGFEALVRWENRELGMINPMYFIPIAEETRLILPLGKWILEEACKTGIFWREEFACKGIMAVNISAVQLKSRGFLDMVKDILYQTGFEPGCLELEITESVFINNYDFTISILRELRELGISISLDDFGTGYSSLSYLKNLPINVLKIDKSFIKNICGDMVEKEIAGAVISLVHKLGLETIAEGVETNEQMEYLIQANCDSIQGFLSGRPVPKDMVPEIIKRGCMQKVSAKR